MTQAIDPYQEERHLRADGPAALGAELWHPEAEEAALGACLIEFDAALRLAELLPDPAVFRTSGHRAVYHAIVALAARGVRIDPVTLLHEAETQGTRPEVEDVLHPLVDAVPSAINLEHYAAILRDRHLRRQLIRDASAAIGQARDLTKPVATAVTTMVDRLVKAADPASQKAAVSPVGQFNAILARLERQAEFGDSATGHVSNLPDLDQLTDGWQPGRLVVVAARPKMGKTSFGVHCAEAVAETGTPVLFVSAEAPAEQIQARRLARETGCELRAIRSPKALDEWAPRLSRASTELAQRPLHITQNALSPSAIRLSLQRLQADVGPVGLVVVDYLGKLRSDTKKERHDLDIGEITWALSRMSIDLEVPVLLLCQLNRESVRGGVIRPPVVSDLRDSGSIEQDADQVAFLWRKDDGDDKWPANRMQIDLQLNRHGPSGRVDVAYQRSTGRWKPYWGMEAVA